MLRRLCLGKQPSFPCNTSGTPTRQEAKKDPSRKHTCAQARTPARDDLIARICSERVGGGPPPVPLLRFAAILTRIAARLVRVVRWVEPCQRKNTPKQRPRQHQQSSAQFGTRQRSRYRFAGPITLMDAVLNIDMHKLCGTHHWSSSTRRLLSAMR